ncbi:DNRLRE domain-containing protein [Paenibacillus sp. LMG 31461]|uniref:DNRLRE domain-containing protein n=1 Tax=Paenibacillus plantarum TaxID=2654975 RepID=A0ABX1X3I4_9BACL|nr:DNRLRE domain-containing protein [Paenibacillus plantarum]NOU62859.1 DNRLRE domain-containing protein [Paenibacillus plantarum]
MSKWIFKRAILSLIAFVMVFSILVTIQPENVSAADTTYTSTSDSYVRSGVYASTNYGTETQLFSKKDLTYADNKRISYIKFDFTGASSFNLAKLKITTLSANNDHVLHVYGLNNDSWTETGITWNNAPNNNTAGYGLTGTGITDIGSVTNLSIATYEIDVTNYVVAQTDKIVTFAIVTDTTDVSYADAITSREGSNKPALILSTVTNPLSYHLDIAPGNYDVTVVLGDSTSAGSTAIQAEARRTMIKETVTTAGSTSTQTFTVNVRSPEGQPSSSSGTEGLDLVFTGSSPKYKSVSVVSAASPVGIYLAGDSTTCDQNTAPWAGWGQMFPQYFKKGTFIANYADSGENAGSFLNGTLFFKALIAKVKANDYVFIQFGHNDKTTTKADYQANLTSMINQTKEKGAIPVLVTPPVRRLFNSDNTTLSTTALHVNSLGVNLPAAMKEVATTTGIKLIDLTAKSKTLIESLGVEGSKKIYMTVEANDNTHFNEYGANEMAKLVVQAIQELNIPIEANIR